MQDILTTFDNSPSYPIIQTELLTEKLPLVLIAEPDAAHRTKLKELLDLYDVAVLEAHNGEAAIDSTVRECPNLIFINSGLPKLDGYETVRLIRSIKSFDDTPIVFLSGETESALRRKAFAVGADSFHLAPLNLERIDWILERFLFPANTLQ